MANPIFHALLSAAISLKPDPTLIPGNSTGQKLVDGLAGLLLTFAAGNFVVGVSQWIGGNSHRNPGTADAGKKRAGLSLAGVAAIGAGATILNWALQLGTTVK